MTGWWRTAEEAARRIAWPRTDVARADAAAADVLGGSALVVAAAAVLTTFERAWTGSMARAIVVRLGDTIPVTATLRVRFAATVVIVAGLTVLALQVARSGPREPLAWLVPTMTIAAAVLVAATGAGRRQESGDGRR
jgi:hypothetical protein